MRKDINNFEQNHPELVVADLNMINSDFVRDVLKYRGINKWLRVRKLLIQLKIRWCEEIKELQEEKSLSKYLGLYERYFYIKGFVEALTDCRQQIRAFCHSPRDVDFPKDKHKFGDCCILPSDFPNRPHKRWIKK